MRKTSLTFFMIAALTVPLWGQVNFDEFSINSTRSYTSFGLFTNPLDGAANVDEEGMGPGFSELENSHLFGGLANLNRVAASADPVFTTDTDEGLSIPEPMILGFYSAGSVPWSVFAGSRFEPLDQRSNSYENALNGPNNEVVTEGTTDTSYTWYDYVESREYEGKIADTILQYGQFLTSLAGINTGAVAGVYRGGGYDAEDNYTETRQYQYDAAVAGEVPNPAVDFRRDYELTDYDFDKTTHVGLQIPAYLRTGRIGHSAGIGVEYRTTDRSFNQSLEYSVPQDNTNIGISTVSAADLNDILNDNTDDSYDPEQLSLAPVTPAANQFTELPTWGKTEVVTSIPVSARYALSMPFFGEHEENRLMVGINGQAEMRTAEYRREETWQLYDFTPGGEGTPNTRNEAVQGTTVSAVLPWEVGVNAMHSFYFDFGENVVFGARPGISAALARDIGYDDPFDDLSDGISFSRAHGTLDSRETTVSTDGNNDGAFDADADTITTTTETYTNGVIGEDGQVYGKVVRSELSGALTLPVSLEFQPADWNFSVLLGSNPRVSFTRSDFTGTPVRTRTEVSSEDGTGQELDSNPDVEVRDPAQTYRYSAWDWRVAADYRIGLNMALPDGISMDVSLDLSGEFNILDFESFVIQTTVPLP